VIEKGDAIRTDYVGYLQSYPGHQSRTVIVGEPRAQQKRDYAINLKCIAASSTAAGRVRTCTTSGLDDGRVPQGGLARPPHADRPRRGCWWHQQEPILRRKSEHVLEEGMVLALEPHVNFWHVQDMILVQSGAPELLSPKFSTDQPFVVAA
jgi:Xaa-Pro aminopeptidase